MKNNFVFYSVLFLTLILSQILVFNQLEIGLGIHIMIYPMFVLALPFDMRPATVMILGFLTGITIDWYTNSFGLHASSAVFLAYLRPKLFSFLEPREGYDTLKRPLLRDMGRNWFFTIYAIGLLLHHLWFFTFEIFKFSEIFFILQKALLSTFASLLMITMIQIIFFNKQKEL